MITPSNVTTRYSDEDLKEFKKLLEDKFEKAKSQYLSLKEQLKDITENNNDDFAKDITDFSSIQTEVEMLNNMANHQRKYIQDLENALIRINNKSYGICVTTGELIDKKRLMAVPTTTKSVTAKTQSEMKDVQVPKDRMRGFDDIDDGDDEKPVRKAEPKKPVIITKVIKKPSSASKASADIDDDDLDKIFSELDVIKELDEADLGIDEDDDSFSDDEDLDMIADDEPEDYDDDDME
ncbi:MAG: TraR/DksA family transcriptional regulator [Saprospiraceae bacterium]|jgi:RNA polymerase-binding protein DksA|nr:TraR/DksA family transcriptional regulator [Saprospiraceae bacterium]MBP6235166.1 TraR/DksA family transcriptional regulator [Saprospiraceae bacterium]MBP6565998.1 TraR/DksA family transcriptional regulator [Saprospiraceae bacterium]